MDDVTRLLDGLNPAQRDAVSADPGHYLVLAGAGSGKTRVLTQRIAWLVEVEGVWPQAVYAVTFTNKAAAEMRGRVEAVLQRPLKGLWIGTFHGLAHRLLRLHAEDAGLKRDFQILDAADQLRLVKRVLADLGGPCAEMDPKMGVHLINRWKDEGLRPERVDGRSAEELNWIAVYKAYEAACRRQNVVDFAELLLRPYELLQQHPALLGHYRQRFGHVLVDEFQDTNTIQYLWVRQLVGDTGQVFAVGDDDQSIYSWRGARVEHMLKAEKDFPQLRLIKLEQNYRSTGTILKAANAVIARNQTRLGKELWTEAGQGDAIELHAAHDETEEARFVIGRIQRWVAEGGSLRESAILYRSNAQSRVFEEQLLRAGLPYRIWGGQRFFERAEVKDALAWLRLSANPDDDAALERVLTTPPRGIGERSIARLRELALEQNLSLHGAFQVGAGELRGQQRRGWAEIQSLLEQIGAPELPLAERVRRAIDGTGLRTFYASEDRFGTDARADNLDELVNVAGRWSFDPDDEESQGQTELTAFLGFAALEAGEAQAREWEDGVQLMTLHAAKGLEFPLVFLAGMEDGLFPGQRAIDDGIASLEEERRLAYVGITRARRQLVMTWAESRRRRGEAMLCMPSRFLYDLPKELIRETRPRLYRNAALARTDGDVPGGYGSFRTPPPTGIDLPLGARVSHLKYGEGVVTGVRGQGPTAVVEVEFEEYGQRYLKYAVAGLVRIG